MMDRNKGDELPKLQVGFIDFVCTFVYKVRIIFFPCCSSSDGTISDKLLQLKNSRQQQDYWSWGKQLSQLPQFFNLAPTKQIQEM